MSINASIIDIEIYYPHLYVEQKDLEIVDNCASKYVIGLGQIQMAVCNTNEDSISMALTVVHRFMKRTGTGYLQIGRIDVGSETPLDLSKSIKTNIMKLFNENGNYSVEGADNVNACYGGTAALFNCLNWVESRSWNGKFGLVVTTDIAIYSNEVPSARATGGAAAICILIGPNGPISVENAMRGVYCTNSYDFCKPLSLNYPSVNGRFSQWMYIHSILRCSIDYVNCQLKKNEKFNLFSTNNLFAFHCPYTKLVQKGFIYMSYLHNFPDSSQTDSNYEIKITRIESLLNDANKNAERAEFEKAQFSKVSSYYNENLSLSLDFSKCLGNSYCSSIYMCLSSIIANSKQSNIDNKRIILYSYGSGCISSMYSLLLPENNKNFEIIKNNLFGMKVDLEKRCKITFEQMIEIFSNRKKVSDSKVLEDANNEFLSNDCFYLKSIESDFSREYMLKL